MLICTDCGYVFLEAKYYTETHGFESGPYESWWGCPNCGGPFTKAHTCACCEEWIDCSYVKLESGERICENCYTKYELGEED